MQVVEDGLAAMAVGEGEEGAEAVPAAPLEKLTLPVLKVVMDAQALHGLRYGDYQRYRQYCTRRMRRLRQSTKFLHWEQGKGKSKFVKRDIEEDTVVDVRFLAMILNKAERAWAYAMQLREAPGGPGREVHHVMRLLAKAVKHSASLVNLCQARADDRTCLEAEAYAAWLAGNMHLEREEWEEALTRLTRASTVYNELAQSTEDAAVKAVYKQRVEEIEPSVRYCRYNVARARGEAVDEDLTTLGAAGAAGDLLKAKVEKSLAEARMEQAKAHGSVSWLGEDIQITSAEVNQHLLSAEALSAELEKPEAEAFDARMELYDKILMALEDAKQKIRDEVSGLLKSGDDDGRAPGLQTLRTYVQGAALLRARDRDLLLVRQLEEKLARRETGRKATRPEDLVGMFENIVQNAEELAALPGVAEYAPLAKLQAARGLLFKAWRILYLSASYLDQGQAPEALALVERAQQLGKVARTRMGEAGTQDATDALWLDKLQSVARVRRVEALAAALKTQAETAEAPSAKGASSDSLRQLANTPLTARLQSYEAAVFGEPGKVPKLVDFPPPIEAVACKPTLFDLALNKVDYPDISARSEAKKAGKGGLLGWFRK